jgi:hypothetical protein
MSPPDQHRQIIQVSVRSPVASERIQEGANMRILK